MKSKYSDSCSSAVWGAVPLNPLVCTTDLYYTCLKTAVNWLKINLTIRSRLFFKKLKLQVPVSRRMRLGMLKA
jgi:hypothetical protein